MQHGMARDAFPGGLGIPPVPMYKNTLASGRAIETTNTDRGGTRACFAYFFPPSPILSLIVNPNMHFENQSSAKADLKQTAAKELS